MYAVCLGTDTHQNHEHGSCTSAVLLAQAWQRPALNPRLPHVTSAHHGRKPAGASPTPPAENQRWLGHREPELSCDPPTASSCSTLDSGGGPLPRRCKPHQAGVPCHSACARTFRLCPQSSQCVPSRMDTRRHCTRGGRCVPTACPQCPASGTGYKTRTGDVCGVPGAPCAPTRRGGWAIPLARGIESL